MKIERIDDEAPKPIIDLFKFPYDSFSEDYKSKDDILLDIACGEGPHYEMLKSKFKEVIMMDTEVKHKLATYGSVSSIPLPDKSVDYAFCFETIEHLTKEDQAKALKELKRVTRKNVIIGSVDEYGLDYVGGFQIFKAATFTNPYHLNELNPSTFQRLIETEFKTITYYQSNNSDDGFVMEHGLSVIPKKYCNYAVCVVGD